MAEIYVNSNTPIKTKIYWEGELVIPDGNVTAAVYDITEDPAITPAILPTTVLTTLTATAVETDTGTYQVVLPFSYSVRNRKFKLVWSYVVSSVSGTHITYVDVATPYINLNEHIDSLNLGSDPSDPNYKTYNDIRVAERYARKIIEDYTGQEFYLYDDTEVVYGNNSDILPLPYKINSIYQLYSNDILFIDNTTNPATNNWTYTPIISETGFGIRVDRTGLIDNTVYVANGMVPPTINDNINGAFAKNVRYKVIGKYGWDLVPSNVQQACVELMKDYFSKDNIWKNKYVKNIQTFDWQFEYSGDAYRGTGNAYVDQLLNPYVINGMVVI
jgi:hypothetical protein